MEGIDSSRNKHNNIFEMMAKLFSHDPAWQGF